MTNERRPGRASGYQQPHDWQTTRARIIRRDPFCQLHYLGCDTMTDTVDHRIPVVQHGGHHDGNLQGVCTPCHTIKTERERLAGIAQRSRRRPTRSNPNII